MASSFQERFRFLAKGAQPIERFLTNDAASLLDCHDLGDLLHQAQDRGGPNAALEILAKATPHPLDRDGPFVHHLRSELHLHRSTVVLDELLSEDQHQDALDVLVERWEAGAALIRRHLDAT